MQNKKIKRLIVGTNNSGKLKEIRDLLPKNVKIHSTSEFKLKSPRENGKTFIENSLIKSRYFSKKTNLICLSDDSGLEIDALQGKPGIYSSRWGGKKNNFNLAIKKVYSKIKKIDKKWENKDKAKFICCLTIFWPGGKIYSGTGIIKGRISKSKKGKKGFGYDPIFIPNGFKQTFGQMNQKLKMSIDHRYKAYTKIKSFFN